jgi:predicted dehydrogenase
MKSSRRDFLKNTAATTGLGLLSGLGGMTAVHGAGSDVLKVALIGCGARGAGAAANCLSANKNVQLTVMADAFENNARTSLANLRNIPELEGKINVPEDRIFVGFDAYQKAIAAGPDIVLLASPPGFRPLHYAAATAAGKHVFMEKPVCVDAPGFRSVMETNKLADAKGLKVVVGLQRRHSREFLGPVNAIRDGLLGDLWLLRAYWNDPPIWIRPRQPGQTEMEFQMRNWYHFVWLSGDHIVEQHVHNLDICNWVKGDHPITAQGQGSCHCRDNRGIGQIYDNHFVEFTYKDGTKLFSQCRQQLNTWRCSTQFVHGTKGVRELPGNGAGDGYPQEHVNLVNAIRSDTKLNDGWHAATSTFSAILGRMASYSGQVVHWDDAVAKGPNEMPNRFAFDADPPAMPDKTGNYPMAVPGIYQPY